MRCDTTRASRTQLAVRNDSALNCISVSWCLADGVRGLALSDTCCRAGSVDSKFHIIGQSQVLIEFGVRCAAVCTAALIER